LKERRLPLGVDIGTARVRVVALSRRQDGCLRLLGAGAADVEDHPASALAFALRQTSTPERRCVVTIRSSDATLQTVVLPPMSSRDANRAAMFEALAGSHSQPEPLAVRPIVLECNARGERRMLIASTPSRIVRETIRVVEAAGLRPICIDHEAYALLRAADSPLLDVGLARSTLVTLAGGAPVLRILRVGGMHFTKALARDYGIDDDVAETRKRTIGLTGAAKDVLCSFVQSLASELRLLREAEEVEVTSLRLCGNGARLPELREEIVQQVGLRVESVHFDRRLLTELPDEVERSATLDWFSAFAAALPAPA
jgi:Tfp pilus assembly PilM family ATPase